MTENLTIQFDTEHESGIPKVGRRRRVQVNGKPETLYVRSVHVEAIRPFGERKPRAYIGTAVLTTRSGLESWFVRSR